MWKTCGQTPASPSGEEGRRTLWEGSTVGQTVALQESLREGGPGGQVAGGRMGSPCVRGAGCGRTRAQSPSPARGQRGQRPPATFAITEPSPGAWVLLSPPAQPDTNKAGCHLLSRVTGSACHPEILGVALEFRSHLPACVRGPTKPATAGR